ncbi:MAG: hypothetical protein J2P22_02630, partial [Nocardioides sp.]|nr:hypothetical protein [Nocardioides sp.]
SAVIAWSWDLLTADEQQALAWLSVFQDGFSAEAARALLGPDGTELVETLVDQSLLSVTEHDGVTRHRMLETVREFGAQRLTEAGQGEAARDAQTRWAVGLATWARPHLFGQRQVEVVDVLDAEETNLADVLRRCLVAGDAPHAVPLLASLGGLWSVTGNFARFLAMSDLGVKVLLDWHPPPELTEVTVEAVVLVLVHLGFMRPDGVADLAAVIHDLPEPSQPWSRVARAMFAGSDFSSGRRDAVLALTRDADRRTAAMAWQWAAILAENEGALEDSRSYLEQALAMVDEHTTVWEVATLHTQCAMQALNRGEHEEAAEHAMAAIPLLHRLHAEDDAFSMRTGVALSALRRGRLDEAERLLDEAGEPPATDVTAGLVRDQAIAELLLVRGDVAGGLDGLDRSLANLRGVVFAGMSSSGLEPWSLIPLATALAAYSRYADTDERRRRGRHLAAEGVEQLSHLRVTPDSAVDYPVVGMGLAALGAWLLTIETDADRVEAGVRLVALAHGFSYNRWFPAMDWERLRALADDVAPGRLDAVLEEYDGRQGRGLRPEAERVLDSLRVTSSG